MKIISSIKEASGELIVLSNLTSTLTVSNATVTLWFEDLEPTGNEIADSTLLFQQHDIDAIVNSVHNLVDCCIYDTDASVTKSNRAAAVYMGIGAILKANYHDLLASLVRSGATPNYWILANFDFYLNLGGRLLEVLDDYLASGIVVTSTGVVVEND